MKKKTNKVFSSIEEVKKQYLPNEYKTINNPVPKDSWNYGVFLAQKTLNSINAKIFKKTTLCSSN